MNDIRNWDLHFSADAIRAALENKSSDEIVDSVYRALEMALPVCFHTRPTGKRNRIRAAMIELEWRADNSNIPFGAVSENAT